MEHLAFLLKMGRPWRLTSQTKPSTIIGTGLQIARTKIYIEIKSDRTAKIESLNNYWNKYNINYWYNIVIIFFLKLGMFITLQNIRD